MPCLSWKTAFTRDVYHVYHRPTEKILATILSRVQHADFRSIAADEMAHGHGQRLQKQRTTYEDATIDLIVRHARGGIVTPLFS